MAERNAIHPEFADLWPGSRARVDAALEAVERGIAAAEQGAVGDEVREEARDAAHKLVGTLGTFGLQATARTVRELELAFTDGTLSDPARLRARLEAVERAVESA